MGAGKYDNKHWVGIMLNNRWRKRIIDIKYINERAITAGKHENKHGVGIMLNKRWRKNH